jgi:hypothetical protein
MNAPSTNETARMKRQFLGFADTFDAPYRINPPKAEPAINDGIDPNSILERSWRN